MKIPRIIARRDTRGASLRRVLARSVAVLFVVSPSRVALLLALHPVPARCEGFCV